ncbi:myosin-16 [Limosa lapponica baueri]|uniref:Myosin-16 n=1 Tax=Limosa lapponica baueri TaxID=1758121 RepID=A0A2I0TPI2_LIMLA|nr:myosin-16 [Limosa lapponica baueri]
MSNAYKEECVDDADPMQFLAPPGKEKTEAMNKLYDIKTSYRVKDEKGGFLAEEIQSEKDDKVMVKMESLEDQIIQVNPVLETLDNPKTVRKKNSSRFGSTSPSLIGHWKQLREIIVSSIGFSPRRNSNLLVAFDVLGSSPEERICVSKLTRGTVHLGTVKFKQKPREEQAEVDNTAANAACGGLDKKQRVFGKMLAEWQQKRKEECTTENSELKTVYEESLEHLESMKKENKAF